MTEQQAEQLFNAINAEYPQATDLQRCAASQDADRLTADQNSQDWLDAYCTALGNLTA